jgi:hypothetical protein
MVCVIWRGNNFPTYSFMCHHISVPAHHYQLPLHLRPVFRGKPLTEQGGAGRAAGNGVLAGRAGAALSLFRKLDVRRLREQFYWRLWWLQNTLLRGVRKADEVLPARRFL